MPTDQTVNRQANKDTPVYTGQAARERFRVTLNGQVLSDEQRWFELQWGKTHILSVSASAKAEDNYLVEVTKILPDGTSQAMEQQMGQERRGVSFDIGPLLAPARYEFDHGTTYRRGYRVEVRIRQPKTHKLVARFDYYQGIPYDHSAECLYPGREARVVHGPPLANRHHWWIAREDSYPSYPLLPVRLRWPPVQDGKLGVEYTYRAQQGQFPVVLHIENEQGEPMCPDRRLTAQPAWPADLSAHERKMPPPHWQTEEVNISGWPQGRYRVELWPVIEGKVYQEGATVTWVHHQPTAGEVAVSPYANWTLRRDEKRPQIVMDDMGQALRQYGQSLPQGWKIEAGALVSTGEDEAEEIRLDVGLEGYYALFARPVGGSCMLRYSDEDFRRAGRPDAAQAEPFIGVKQMDNIRVHLIPSKVPGKGVAALRFVPVTASSARQFLEQTRNPPVPLQGISDWHGVYKNADTVEVQPRDFDFQAALACQVGMNVLHWHAGRGFLLYHSELPFTTEIGELAKGRIPIEYVRRYYPLFEKIDPLNAMLNRREEYGHQLYGWLCMNRQYAASYGDTFSSRFHIEHPQWHFRNKDGSTDHSRVSYFFTEPREERVAILKEIAARGVDGLTIGFCRQPPMIDYHPEMVAAYQEKTGVDPRQLDGSDGQKYLQWLQWRAQFVTDILRRLRTELKALEDERGRNIPVVVRIPSDGILANLAEGLDIRLWCKEGLIDEMHLVPLNPTAGGQAMDIRPYVRLGEQTGVRVVGGINLIMGEGVNKAAFLRRAAGLARAGVDAIEVYESEMVGEGFQWRWMVALAGHPQRIEDYLAQSNLEACFPIDSWGAVGGHDNHFQCILRTLHDIPGALRWSY